MSRRIGGAVPVAVALVLTSSAAAAQKPTLAAVLQRAGAYVADFQRQLSSIVAEERYVQSWKDIWPGERKATIRVVQRELLSDLLLVKPGRDATWMEFRDVFEVDGKPVRERDERLVKMFLEPSPSTRAQIDKILEESARFNIGDIERNVNTPIFPLLFLEIPNQPRFAFKQTSDRRPKNIDASVSADGAFGVSNEAWVIQYEEKAPGTMIRTNGHNDLPSRGRFWIEPGSGRVLVSELILETGTFRATIDVSYRSGPVPELLVPAEMRERYEVKGNISRIEGRATYGRFRQFQVNVDETFAPIVRK